MSVANDPIFAQDYAESLGRESVRTTVLPKSWEFNSVGNTKLKRKRKHAVRVTEADKRMEWFGFCCANWGVKLNRETRMMFAKRLKTTSKKEIEEEIKEKSDDQRSSPLQC